MSESTSGQPRTPSFLGGSFTCPHPQCGALAQMLWSSVYVEGEGGAIEQTTLQRAECFACHEFSIWREHDYTWGNANPMSPLRTGTMLFPLAVTGTVVPPSSDMPDDVRGLYEEATAVAAVSPRAASALLRLALESLLGDLYGDAGNLNAMIGEAKRQGLSDEVTQALDVLRFNGNGAVHELRREDDPQIVETMFWIVNLAVDQLITSKRRIREMYDAMPDSVREAIKRRDESDQD